MESKEDYDILSIVADTVMKWYDQTHTTMTIGIKPFSGLDVELMGILLTAKKQTLGALTTLANKHVLSTHALLRTLVEIHVALLWFLNVPPNEKRAKSDEVYRRLRRWDYTRLKKDRVLLENLPQTTEIESAIRKAEEDIEKLQTGGIKELPNFKQLYDDLEGEWVEAYPRFYMKYSRAVHLNRNVTQKLAWLEYENGDPKAVLHKDDIEPDGDELVTIACISCDLNEAIRHFYSWHSEAMQSEYEQLRSKLVKK
jgi:hypothetical protein